jgi:hypothetical protein
MSPVTASYVETWADFLPSAFGYRHPPVDLLAVARHRQIKQLGFRLMVPRAVLVPVEKGFEAYLRDSVPRDVNIAEAEPSSLLTHQQRFSLAHEIAHTFFFRLSDAVPVPVKVNNSFDLEKVCNRVAGRILVPAELLREEIKREVGEPERVDAAFVRSAASKFRTSIDVLIGRLRVVEPSNSFERCVLLVRKIEGDAVICASYFGAGLLSVLPSPVKFTRLTDWFADFPRYVIDGAETDEWTTSRMGRSVRFVKSDLRSGGDFLLQVETSTCSQTTAASPSP